MQQGKGLVASQSLNRFTRQHPQQSKTKAHTLKLLAAAASLAIVSTSALADADDFGGRHGAQLFPGNLVISRSVYDNKSSNVTVGTVLPPGCAQTTGGCSASTGAPYDGTYPFVWNDDTYDAAFGITSKIFLDQITTTGWPINTIEVPNTTNENFSHDHLATSFSSKSELALNLSSDRKYLTFMGYVAPINAIDVSNSNTPGAVDTTNPDGQSFYRAVARVDANGRFTFTETNAYSGNNGRAAILLNGGKNPFYVTTGNAGNGANPQPNGIILGAGTQFVNEVLTSEASQTVGTPAPLASFSVTELGAKADKIGKDDNFRGLTVFNNVVYMTKGSGSNGVNTVYFVDTTGKACPNGVGVPAANAPLPSSALSYDAATLQTAGLPNNMCILAGFPTTPNKSATTTAFPFGVWFADANTLYVADEGDGYTGGTDLYTHAAAQTTAGLQKWVYNASKKTWSLAYTLQKGLNLGTPYTVRGYPQGTNPGTNLPWSPATDGLRNLTGHVYRDGSVYIWAMTSTISGNGDTGADPNKLVVVRDIVSNTNPTVAQRSQFVTLRDAGFGEVYRGVSFTPDAGFGFDPQH
ncbi:conserved exported protein of unknown function [Pararobbsia alpina]|uniref:hypothetical protein n=1 Tax=Pararobbsia alpina TaxID=621374 RepID=UPI0039A6FD4D